MAKIEASHRVSLIQAAVLAPSADNCHAFELEATDERILLFGNQAYSKAPFHRQVLALLSFGAVAENIRVRAAALGYKAAIAWLPDPSTAGPIAELRFEAATATDQALSNAIPLRHTNRRLRFHGPPLSEAELMDLRNTVADLNGVSLRFLDSGEERTKLLQLLRIAEAERFNTEALHRELFSAIRFDAGWHAPVEQGLAPGALGVEPGARWGFRQLGRWSVMDKLRRMGVHKALAFRAAQLPCRLAPHRAVLVTRLPLQPGALMIGMALQRIWLKAESRGWALQPFAAPALLALPGYTDVPAGTRDRLRAGWRDLVPDTPLMVFRMGIAKRSAVRSGRPASKTFLRG